MRLFIAVFALTGLLLLGLLHVQSFVMGVWACGVDPVAVVLAETGRPPDVSVSRGPGPACGPDPSTPTTADRRPVLVRPACIPGGTRTLIPGPDPEGYRWIPRMPNAVDVECERGVPRRPTG